ncbi:hypothetical protein DUI87_17815 [Hirundo rustica rustica]|uniref:Uncharacterized protein n=1 Tax=Hirundo rustica rustica TaxID=333673 RepID=A0A3M0KBU6_HIRRU|nr:hypothetical protein DUI87_17815 [Hirundo rustica rustica]
MVAEPSAQDLVTANATPAEAMAWTKADSLVAVEERSQAAFTPFSTQPVFGVGIGIGVGVGIGLTLVQEFALGFVELRLAQTHISSLPSSLGVHPFPPACDCTTQPGVTSKLPGGALDPTVPCHHQMVPVPTPAPEEHHCIS